MRGIEVSHSSYAKTNHETNHGHEPITALSPPPSRSRTSWCPLPSHGLSISKTRILMEVQLVSWDLDGKFSWFRMM